MPQFVHRWPQTPGFRRRGAARRGWAHLALGLALCYGLRPFVSSALTTPIQAARPEGRFPWEGMSALTEADEEVVWQRHLFKENMCSPEQRHQEVKSSCVGAGQRCRHGWPQAVLFYPVRRRVPDGKPILHGAIFRLTCPLLTEGVDRLEQGDGVRRSTDRVEQEEAWRTGLASANEASRAARAALLQECDPDGRIISELRVKHGNDVVDRAFASDLVGQQPGATDTVKCIHAHVADELVRAGGNPVALDALGQLEADGVPLRGSDTCCDHCNVSVGLDAGRWTYLARCPTFRKRQRWIKGAPKRSGTLALRNDGLGVRERTGG